MTPTPLRSKLVSAVDRTPAGATTHDRRPAARRKAVLPPMTPAPSPSPWCAKGSAWTRDRFAAVNAFVDVALAALGRAEVAVWLILWRDTKPDGTARTSQADLARRAGSNVRRSSGRARLGNERAVDRRPPRRPGQADRVPRPSGRAQIGDTGVTLQGDIWRPPLVTWVSPIP
ncbi:MAG: hypothetical protein U0746_13820 [Gemmataceae bacterium]